MNIINYFNEIPKEIIGTIFSKNEPFVMCRLAQVSKLFKEVAENVWNFETTYDVFDNRLVLASYYNRVSFTAESVCSGLKDEMSKISDLVISNEQYLRISKKIVEAQIPQLNQLMAKEYSLLELKGLVEFCSSPAGKAHIKKWSSIQINAKLSQDTLNGILTTELGRV